jgi:hypothetical protein
MKTELVYSLLPEEEELAAKREELARLQLQLAEQELFLASLNAELAAFEGLYLRQVGVLYAELDEWNARLAEIRAGRLATPDAKTEAAEARTQAEESHSAAYGEAAQVQPFTPSPELKKLYREAAKRVHPDTATDGADRARRERLMKEVNAAYAAGDEDALQRILASLNVSPDAVQGSGLGADLIRVLRQLKQVRDRLSVIALESTRLAESEMSKLKAKADIATAKGRDLLAEMATCIQGRVNVVRQQYEVEITKGIQE